MANKGMHKYSVQESQNFQIGQGKSYFVDTPNQNITSTGGLVFVAIQVIQDCEFDTLVAEHANYCVGSGGTDAASGGGDYDAANNAGDLVTNTTLFPAGMVIYGRWTSFQLDQGIVIAYLGS
tara:strand:+ start:1868 stop:2233 length:366 start_codon:yes stop_codon:yes gene_type:complete